MLYLSDTITIKHKHRDLNKLFPNEKDLQKNF